MNKVNSFVFVAGIVCALTTSTAEAHKVNISTKNGGVVIPTGNFGEVSITGNGEFGVVPESMLLQTNDAIGRFSDIDATAKLQEGCRIGMFATIGPGVSCAQNANVGAYTHVDATATLREGCRIGMYANIGSGASCGQNSKVGSYTKVKDGVRIQDQAIVGDYTTVGAGSDLSGFVRSYVTIDQNVLLKTSSIIDNSAHIGENSTVGSKVYVGQHVNIDTNVRIGESSLVYEYVYLPNETEVAANHAVVLATSNRLFRIAQKCKNQSTERSEENVE